jgi:flagella basal body P-ring formation protein FlgA
VARDPNTGQLVVQVQVDDRDVTRILQCNTLAGCEVVGGDPRVPDDQTVTTRFRDRKGNPAEFTVRCRISSQPQILAARYTIPPGHILREADLAWRQAENVDGVVARLEEALNRETRRLIRQDEPIRASDIRAVPLVRSNDIVTVISRRGGVVIKAEMKSRGEGTMGDTVTLVSLKGQDLVLARVTGLHEAEVISADGPTSNTLQDETGRIEFRGELK